MNRINLRGVCILLAFFMAGGFSGCGNQMVRKESALPLPDRIIYECNGNQFASDTLFIRSWGEGRSRNESTAHRIADLDASVNLARAVNAFLNKVSDFRDREQMNRGTAAFEWEDQLPDESAINMMLSGISTICSETGKDGDYFTVLKIVEIPIENIIED